MRRRDADHLIYTSVKDLQAAPEYALTFSFSLD
jgi:hypothetical protein